MRRWLPPALAVLALVATALAGDLRIGEMLRWYLSLRRPPWQPPDPLIPIVWGAIYALIAWAVLRAWRAAGSEGARDHIVAATTVNLFLNALWALLFFVHRRPDWALVEVAALLASILWMIAALGRQDRVAGWLLVPYLAWVGFAAVLNYALVRLNAPFP